MAEKAELVLSASDRTAAAFASAQRNLSAFGKGADSALSKLRGFIAGVGALGLATAGINATLNPKVVIDYADQLNKLSQRTGIAVEDLSALDHAAKLADVSTDELASALKRLNQNIAAAARGEKEQADAFAAIGVSVVDAAGKVRSVDNVLADVADRFQGYSDGANKVALANAIGGRSFEALIPLLNSGSQGLRDARAELEKFGGVISGDLARQSEKFNDNLTRIGVALSAAKVALAGGLIGRLVELSDKFLEAAKSGNLLSFSIERLKAVLSGRATREFVFGEALAPDRLKEAQAEVDALNARVAELQQKLAADPKNAKLARDLRLVADTAKSAAAELETLRAQQQAPGQDPRREKDTSPATPRKDAPPLPKTGAANEALANLRKVLDGNLKLIAGTLAATQDELRHHEQVSQALLEQGTQSLERFYADQDKARQDNLAAIRQATDAEIAERERLLNSPLLKGPDKAAERQDVRNQIAAARATLAAAERDAAQQQELDTIARRRAVEALRDEVSVLDAQIRDLATGSNVESDLLQIANRVREAGRAFVRDGATEEEAAQRAAELGRLLELQREFNQTRENFARVTNEAAAAEELLLIAARKGGAGLLETEDQVREARIAALEQIEALVAKTRELLALNPGNSQLQEGLRELEVQAARARESVDPRKLRLDAAADDIGSSVADGFSRAVTEANNLREIVNDIGRSIAATVQQEVITKPLATEISNIIKGAGGKGTGQNLIGQLFGLNQPQAADPKVQEQQAATAAATAEATAKIAGLGTAATGSADVLGKLPQLAGIPATTALGSLAGAAQIAAAALLQIGAGKGTSIAGEAFEAYVASGGFSGGGYTGNAPEGEAAGVVHGKEFVLSAPAVRAIGVPALEALHEAARSGKTPLLPGTPGAAGQGGAGGAAGAGGIGGAAGAPGAAGVAAAPAHVAIQNLQQIGGPTEAAVLSVPVPSEPGRPGEGGAAGAPAIAVQNLRMAVAHAAPGAAGVAGAPGAPATATAVARTINAAAQAAEAVTPGPESPPGTRPVAAAPTPKQIALQNISLTGTPGLPAAASPGAPGGPGGDGAAASPVHIAVGNLLQMARAPVPREWREAVRMHTGGIVGQLPDLRPNEVPLIAERGEELVPRRDPRHRENRFAMRSGDTFNVHLQGKTDNRTPQQIANAIALEQRRASRLA